MMNRPVKAEANRFGTPAAAPNKPDRSSEHELDAVVPNCKGCSASVHVKPEEIAELYGGDILLRPGSVKLVTESEFLRRLSTCGGCSDYRWGTTCRWSGALMEIKAKLDSTRCPSPHGSKWA
ncbi:hypothetical protein [Paenibacillus sp. HB172176]|uniref:hypothetical protein n=1 Tax=Paenibacillus sp. HB172176 TaxID=2493690 RepID=UPI001439F7E0|nr:hypothetical protein [Paenibacillus sp. HB172176]